MSLILKKRQSKRSKIVGWQTVVDHINNTWKRAKNVDYNYPWRGKDIADLAHHARNFQPWGVMALWDVYLESADEWVTKHGYGLDGFFRALPWLLDKPWKGRAGVYEKRMLPPLNPKVALLFGDKFAPKKRPQKQTRLEWLQERAGK